MSALKDEAKNVAGDVASTAGKDLKAGGRWLIDWTEAHPQFMLGIVVGLLFGFGFGYAVGNATGADLAPPAAAVATSSGIIPAWWPWLAVGACVVLAGVVAVLLLRNRGAAAPAPAATKIGELAVAVTANTDQFHEALAAAETRMEAFFTKVQADAKGAVGQLAAIAPAAPAITPGKQGVPGMFTFTIQVTGHAETDLPAIRDGATAQYLG
jgi:hypothetical protein